MKIVGCIIALASLAVTAAWGQRASVRRPSGAPPAAAPCVVDFDKLDSRNRASVSVIDVGFREPVPPPKPQRTAAARAAGANTPIPRAALSGDISPQLCESLKTGNVTADEVTATLNALEREHSNRTHSKRKRFRKLGVSYTYEYVLDVGNLKFSRQPGEGYCSEYNWRYTVRNVSQRDFTVFSTTGEVGLCFSPGFGLFYVPGLSSVMPFPIPGLCFDDAHFNKLDLRNVNDEFEEGLISLIDLAFDKMQKKDAKLCVMGAAVPPWFMPVVVQKKDMVAYCTSTRNCQADKARLAALFADFTKPED